MNNSWLIFCGIIFYIIFFSLCIYALIKLDILLIISCVFNILLLVCVVNKDNTKTFGDFIEKDDCGYFK